MGAGFYPRGVSEPSSSRAATATRARDRGVGVGVRWCGAKTRSAARPCGRRCRSPSASGWGPRVRDAQAEPAEASTPRASSACSSGSAGRPGNASDAMCGRAGGARHRARERPGTTPASAASAACSKRSRSAATWSSAPPCTAARASAGRDARNRPGRAGSRCRRAGRAPGRRRPTAAPAGRPGAATARRRPAGRAACARRARRCRRRARAGAGATGRTPARRRRADGGGGALAVPGRPEQPGDVSDRLTGAELVVDQHHRHDGGIGAHGGGDGLGADDAVRGRGHDVERIAVARERLGAAHDRRVLERADHEVAPARRARRAQHPQRVGLGAAAGEQHLRGLDVQRRRHLAARLFQGPRGRRAPPCAPKRGWRRAPPRRRAARPAPRVRAPSRPRYPGKSRIRHYRRGSSLLGRRGSLR